MNTENPILRGGKNDGAFFARESLGNLFLLQTPNVWSFVVYLDRARTEEKKKNSGLSSAYFPDRRR